MPKLRIAVALIAFCLCSLTRAAEVLTVAQIEKVTGVTGLSSKPAKYDKAALNYLTSKNELAVSIKVASASVYEVWKSQPSMNDQIALASLGDDAISSKTGRYVCFKKGGAGVCVTGMVAVGESQPLVNDAKLLELARLAASTL